MGAGHCARDVWLAMSGRLQMAQSTGAHGHAGPTHDPTLTADIGGSCVAAVSRLAHMVVVDPFFDPAALLCIVTNIVFLALDHADIDADMALTLHIGYYVRPSRHTRFIF